GAGLQHLAHEDVVDLVGGDPGALERRLDGEAAEVGGGEAAEGAGELADRRASTRQDHGTCHLIPQGVDRPATGPSLPTGHQATEVERWPGVRRVPSVGAAALAVAGRGD